MKETWNQNLKGNRVNKQISTPIALSVQQTSVPTWLRSTGIVLGGSALLAVCAHASIPLWFTPVPLSLQPFGVLILGLLLAPRMAACTVAAYLLEGALGLPVFSPVREAVGGMAHLLGPTGGYLLAYPAAALLISYLSRRTSRGFTMALVSAAAGDLLILTCGALWLVARTHTPVAATVSLAALPFLPGDALKVAAAAGIGSGWQRIRRK